MAVALDSVATWLTGKGISNVLVNWMPDTPNAVVVLSASGGAPVMDATFDNQYVHVRCRAATDEAAEALALSVHSLLKLVGGITMGSTFVLQAMSATGPPAYLLRDVDQRTTYFASYSFVTPF